MANTVTVAVSLETAIIDAFQCVVQSRTLDIVERHKVQISKEIDEVMARELAAVGIRVAQMVQIDDMGKEIRIRIEDARNQEKK